MAAEAGRSGSESLLHACRVCSLSASMRFDVEPTTQTGLRLLGCPEEIKCSRGSGAFILSLGVTTLKADRAAGPRCEASADPRSGPVLLPLISD